MRGILRRATSIQFLRCNMHPGRLPLFIEKRAGSPAISKNETKHKLVDKA
jgi:hypothetical protein